jgi:hypothetical protein
MLTREEYEDLWKTHFTGVGIRKTSKEDDNPNDCPNDYCDYLIREHMFEDYLDIFRGRDTRAIRHIQLCEEWYYPHPYFENNVCLIDTPALKYIMIGEAAPALLDKTKKRISISERNKIKVGTYFYDIEQLEKTSWLSTPINAFYNAKLSKISYAKPNTKDDKKKLLVELAIQGYLLIDLFPFSLKYTGTIRKNLNTTGASVFFYERLQKKIDEILLDLKQEPSTDIKVAFSGPPTVHYHLAENIFDKVNPLSTTLGMYNIENIIAPPLHFVLKKSSFHKEMHSLGLLNGKYSMGSLTKFPIFRSCCYDGTNQNPHELFIRNAFDLP